VVLAVQHLALATTSAPLAALALLLAPCRRAAAVAVGPASTALQRLLELVALAHPLAVAGEAVAVSGTIPVCPQGALAPMLPWLVGRVALATLVMEALVLAVLATLLVLAVLEEVATPTAIPVRVALVVSSWPS